MAIIYSKVAAVSHVTMVKTLVAIHIKKWVLLSHIKQTAQQKDVLLIPKMKLTGSSLKFQPSET